MKQVLLVEDEPVTRLNYKELLEDAGFRVAAFGNSASACEWAATNAPDVAVLDLNIGADRDEGFRLCVQLRAIAPSLPVVFLTQDDRDESQITGFRLGADDYIVKDTHSLDVVVVRINALLRRASLTAAPQAESARASLFQVGSLELDRSRLSASWKGRPVELTLTRVWLVEAMASEPGTVRSADELMRAASIIVTPNGIAKHVSAIRRAFEAVDADFQCIVTERARGYRWVADR